MRYNDMYSVDLEVNVRQAASRTRVVMVASPTHAIHVVVVVAHRNSTVAVHRFDIHRVSVGTDVLDCNSACYGSRATADTMPCGC